MSNCCSTEAPWVGAWTSVDGVGDPKKSSGHYRVSKSVLFDTLYCLKVSYRHYIESKTALMTLYSDHSTFWGPRFRPPCGGSDSPLRGQERDVHGGTGKRHAPSSPEARKLSSRLKIGAWTKSGTPKSRVVTI